MDTSSWMSSKSYARVNFTRPILVDGVKPKEAHLDGYLLKSSFYDHLNPLVIFEIGGK